MKNNNICIDLIGDMISPFSPEPGKNIDCFISGRTTKAGIPPPHYTSYINCMFYEVLIIIFFYVFRGSSLSGLTIKKYIYTYFPYIAT